MAAKLKIEKRGDEIWKKSSALKLLSQSQPNFADMILGWSSSKNVFGISKDYSTKVWLQLAQWFLRRRFLCEYPIGSYVKLSSAVGAILIEGPNRQTHFWKRTINYSSLNAFFCWLTAFGYSDNQREATLL
jgi:hypothetical protein